MRIGTDTIKGRFVEAKPRILSEAVQVAPCRSACIFVEVRELARKRWREVTRKRTAENRVSIQIPCVVVDEIMRTTRRLTQLHASLHRSGSKPLSDEATVCSTQS